uniref:Uncharacterized protein n=1 Tax=Cucumis melo TaxID=3656 RepID=A0A9I9ELH0_CUCME
MPKYCRDANVLLGMASKYSKDAKRLNDPVVISTHAGSSTWHLLDGVNFRMSNFNSTAIKDKFSYSLAKCKRNDRFSGNDGGLIAKVEFVSKLPLAQLLDPQTILFIFFLKENLGTAVVPSSIFFSIHCSHCEVYHHRASANVSCRLSIAKSPSVLFEVQLTHCSWLIFRLDMGTLYISLSIMCHLIQDHCMQNAPYESLDYIVLSPCRVQSFTFKGGNPSTPSTHACSPFEIKMMEVISLRWSLFPISSLRTLAISLLLVRSGCFGTGLYLQFHSSKVRAAQHRWPNKPPISERHEYGFILGSLLITIVLSCVSPFRLFDTGLSDGECSTTTLDGLAFSIEA